MTNYQTWMCYDGVSVTRPKLMFNAFSNSWLSRRRVLRNVEQKPSLKLRLVRSCALWHSWHFDILLAHVPSANSRTMWTRRVVT
jgi:hypothetical protein